ncbi:hypothetical protein ACHQM5_030425 [Ranunculus cassubicifolius]
MEGTGPTNVVPGGNQSGQDQAQQPKVAERLNSAVQQQLNLESVKTRAIGLYKAISRILEEFENIRRTNAEPKWQDMMGQFSMVNLELFNIVEDIKKVSKAFVVHPKNVNAENATVLPVMLSSKLLPEMETEDNSKREQLLHGIENLSIPTQIEKLKERISMIDAACGSAEKVLADCRKAYGLGSRQAPAVIPTLDKVQAAKIQEQESILRAAVNSGQGLHIPPDQRQVPSSLPMHLADILTGDGAQAFPDASGLYKTTPPSMTSNASNTQGPVQVTGSQHIGRSIPSPSGAIGTTSFDNTTTSPLPYANSPRSGTNIMNTPSPQQHQQQQHQHQQQQQRQKMIQLPHQQQQILAQQQYRQSSTPGLGQSQLSQLHDMAQNQKFQSVPGQHQMQYSQSLAHQQFQNRQLLQHGMGQNQLGQGNSLRSHLNQFSGANNNSALFNNAQTSPNTQMITNMSATMPSQSLLPRMQAFGLSSGQPQRSHPSQLLSDQMFSMGGTNPGNMMPVQQQQQQQQTLGGGFGNMGAGNPQNLQSSNVVGMQNAASQLPNYQQQQQQQRQQNQQQ